MRQVRAPRFRRLQWFAALSIACAPGCVGLRSHGSDAKATAVDADAAVAPAPPPYRELATSVYGRTLRTCTVGHGPRRVLWIGGIHGNEREGRAATAELPLAFLRTPGAADKVTLTVLEDVNPDGSAANTRGNANGVDLNRNYPAVNFKASRENGQHALDQPESRALHGLVTALQPHLVIVAHSWHDDHFINFDGPAEHLARRFAELSGYKLRRSEDITPTPGSLGSWVGNTLHLPILTLEFHRARDPVEAWRETRRAILAVVLDDV